MSNTDIVGAYRAWLESWGAATKTIKARTGVAAMLLRTYGAEGLTSDNLQEWMARKKPNGMELSAWSRATYYTHVRDFCAWLNAAGYLRHDPSSSLKQPRKPHSLPRPLTDVDVDRVMTAATGRTWDWLLIALLSGLRAHEIAKVRGEDVSPEGIYVEGKGGTKANIPIHPDLWQMALRYPRAGWWFPNSKGSHVSGHLVTVEVSKLFDSLGLAGSVHRMRHTYGTRLLRGGTDIRTVQRLMRHASLQTTAGYLAVVDNQATAAIAQLPSPVGVSGCNGTPRDRLVRAPEPTGDPEPDRPRP